MNCLRARRPAGRPDTSESHSDGGDEAGADFPPLLTTGVCRVFGSRAAGRRPPAEAEQERERIPPERRRRALTRRGSDFYGDPKKKERGWRPAPLDAELLGSALVGTLDLATPCAGLTTAALDHLLEPFQVAANATLIDA
jgi:hypothetical protein